MLFRSIDTFILIDPIIPSPDLIFPAVKNNIAFSITAGRQLIFADRILLNIGMQFGCLPTALPTALKQNKDNLTTNQSLMSYYVNKKLTNLFAFNLKIGVGFLGF